MRILLVEDDKDIVRFIKKGLSENSFSFDVAADGDEGLNLAQQKKYDLIILDIILPKMDGREILGRTRAADIQTPVIFLTAKDSESDIVHGLNAGADDYLVKPFSFSELLARIRALLRRDKKTNLPSRLRVADLNLEFD